MALIHWNSVFDPFRDLRSLQDRMNRLFDASAGGALGVERGTSAFPPLDIRHDADAVYLTAELPGVAPDSLDLSITGDTLTLKGERPAPGIDENRYHRRERRFGHFAREVGLPERVDAEKIEATLSEGVLRVRLPKAESAKPRKINIGKA